jgi:hypothetical protein
MRLIRTIILLTGAGLLLPSPPSDPLLGAGDADATTVSAMEMLSSATSAFSDVAGFCGRQPAACETAAYVAAHLEAKAKYSARLVYEWATEGEQPAGHVVIPVQAQQQADPLRTGSPAPLELTRAAANQSTLRLDDLIPAWRGPVPASHDEG